MTVSGMCPSMLWSKRSRKVIPYPALTGLSNNFDLAGVLFLGSFAAVGKQFVECVEHIFSCLFLGLALRNGAGHLGDLGYPPAVLAPLVDHSPGKFHLQLL